MRVALSNVYNSCLRTLTCLKVSGTNVSSEQLNMRMHVTADNDAFRLWSLLERFGLSSTMESPIVTKILSNSYGTLVPPSALLVYMDSSCKEGTAGLATWHLGMK